MATLKVYNGELFERGKRWYVGFAGVILTILGLSLFYKTGQGVQNIVGSVIMLMIVGGYLFFQSKTWSTIQLTLSSEGVFAGERLIPFAVLKGFVVEMEKKTGKLRNIVFVFDKSVEIFTLNDTPEHQKLFFAELAKVVPFLESYEQGFVEKLIRKIKL
ncbi:hypothetical protein BSK20_00795 [SR1 bacterium human oral taxon HOT-345]|nr:hypothetical protein BSK20_00795 [SR1 bacterium human oral taxon HOT-345]RKW23429.1 MAG: hypothetical protein D8B45_03415 [Candidatus Gracilibacteria bacterium]